MRSPVEFVANGLGWWLSALGAVFIPGRHPLSRHSIRLRPAEGGFSIIRSDGTLRHRIMQTTPNRRAIRFARAARSRYLDLDDDSVLAVKTTLPAPALANLREAVALRMAELTPFSEDEVLFDVAEPTRIGPDRISVQVFVAPRDVVSRLLAELRALGIKVDGVVASETGEVTGAEIPDFAPEIRRRRAVRRGIAFGAACGLLIASLAWLDWGIADRQQRMRDNLERQVAAAISDVRRGDALDQQIAELTASLNSPSSRRVEQLSPLEVLDSVARVLPDDAYLTGFRWSDDELIISGFAADASALIRQLEGSPILAGARFIAPISRDPRLEKDRFSVSARTVAHTGVQ